MSRKYAKEMADFMAKGAKDAHANKCQFIPNLDVNSNCPWKEDDRKWFKRKRNRNYRLRRLAPGELPEWAVENSTHVVIRQVKRGMREKRILTDTVNGKHLDAAPEVEALAVAIWQKADSNNGPIVPFGLMWLTALAALADEKSPS